MRIVNFGVSIQTDDGKKSISGVYPSPAFQDPESILDAVCNFINEHFRTRFAPVPVLVRREVVETGVEEHHEAP